jgi:hypothetical protein
MHWRNSRFQVLYFLVGKTHTPDEAYRVLCELREERQLALNNAQVADKRAQAKLVEAKRIVSSTLMRMFSKGKVLKAEADILEIELMKSHGQDCIDEAERELDFLTMLIKRVRPHCKHKDLPDHEAHQLAQQEEWKYELLTRAENFIGAQGYIPADHFATMRLHPEWESEIAPYVTNLIQARKENKAIAAVKKPMDSLLIEVAKDVKQLT